MSSTTDMAVPNSVTLPALRGVISIGLAMAIILACQLSGANPEPGALSDARSMGMAGVGVATNDYASAPYHNPAGLSSVERAALNVAFTPYYGGLTGPFPDETGRPVTRDTELVLAPFSTLSFGIRVHDRIALGGLGFLTAVSGANYEDVIADKDLNVKAFAGELQLPLAVTVTERLSLGAAYRITFARISATAPQPTTPPAPAGFADTETSLSGWNFAGFSLGARYRINDTVRLGIIYRSKVVTNVSGETEVDFMGQRQTVETDTEFPVPHTLKIGGEFLFFDNMLLVAVDGAYWFYSDSHKRNPPFINATWRDAVAGILGLEYKLTQQIPIRAGTQIGTSATTPEAATPVLVSPGMRYLLTAGTGLKLRRVDLDIALGVHLSPNVTVSARENPQYPGVYGSNSLFGGISANFRL